MRPWIFVLAAALVLSACDAGHRDEPGIDNKWPGPELDIQVPGPGTTVKASRKSAGDPSDLNMFFRVRPMGEHGDLVVRYALDDGAFRVHENVTAAFLLQEPLAPGTRLVSAYLAKKDGSPRFGARSTSVSTFVAQIEDELSGQVLGKDANNPGTGQYGHHDDEGLWHPFDPNAPCLVVDERDGRIHVLAHRCVLDGKHYRVRYLYDDKREGTIPGDDPENERFGKTIDAGKVTITLEEMVGKDPGQWQKVAGSRSEWTNPTP
jgi:hypothetical protein